MQAKQVSTVTVTMRIDAMNGRTANTHRYANSKEWKARKVVAFMVISETDTNKFCSPMFDQYELLSFA